ncbi:hypothetical protein BDR26DRAFT_860367 [Obelidium mucronatum]|nr:hypothetical protein BDR26DRAFT_860367 [Obelidium mucronatum]
MLVTTSFLLASAITSLAAPPDFSTCEAKNWDLGENATDPTAPPGPYPVAGQQVYIQDQNNFCINLPNPNDPTLKSNFYNRGRNPTVLDGEGYVQSYCVGKLAPGALPMPAGAVTAAHVIKNYTKQGEYYLQVTGTLDCNVLNIDCSNADNGGQYDNVPFRNCGKEPYSGVYDSFNSGFGMYVEQAGSGIFCMRVCQGGNQLNDPCNVKNDTAGCYATMDMVDAPGFSFTDVSGQIRTRKTTTTTAAPTTTATLFATVVSKLTTTSSSGFSLNAFTLFTILPTLVFLFA